MTDPSRSRRSGVEVVGHRGASADAPEHTLDAYRQAVMLGADAVECDVRLTRDGVLVCVHDRRIDATSTGRGVVSELTVAELDRLSYGPRTVRRKRDRIGPVRRRLQDDEPDRSAVGVLTLHRLLDYVTSTPGEVRLAIETKHPTRYSALVESTLVADLRRFGLVVDGRPVDRAGKPAVRVMSFSPIALRRIHAMAPGLPTVRLLRRLPPHGLPSPASEITAVGPGLSLLRRFPRMVDSAHATGREVHVWTVNDEADMAYVLDLGVDAVITDRPGALLDHLRGVDVPGPP
jgi:glycerophosphoryl diester phosphodiesterase